jgi:hypothetical protein
VVSFTSLPLYPQGKSRWYPLDRRLSGFQSQSGCSGEEKSSQPLLGLKPLIIQPMKYFENHNSVNCIEMWRYCSWVRYWNNKIYFFCFVNVLTGLCIMVSTVHSLFKYFQKFRYTMSHRFLESIC